MATINKGISAFKKPHNQKLSKILHMKDWNRSFQDNVQPDITNLLTMFNLFLKNGCINMLIMFKKQPFHYLHPPLKLVHSHKDFDPISDEIDYCASSEW